MMKTSVKIGALVLTWTVANMAVAAPPQKPGKADFWPQWRGPNGTGVALRSNPPTEWSEEKNIRWKVPMTGRSHATPIVWGDRVFILTAVETDQTPAEAGAYVQPGDREGRRGDRGRRRGGFGMRNAKPTKAYQFQVMALDRKTGKTVWDTTVHKEIPHEAGHPDASQASASPVTDGEHIYAFFGSYGLYCLDMKGKVKWEKDFGDMKTRNEFGEGSSPALYGDTIIVNWDHEGDDFIVALNKKTGKELWRRDRDEPTTWSSPIVFRANGKPQVVVSATNAICAYDLKTGKDIWSCRGMTANTIPTPMIGNGLLYCISGFRGAALLAIRYGAAKGDITDSGTVAWRYDKDTPYVPSALLYKDVLYFLENNRPILTCLDAKKGEPLAEKRRIEGPDMIYASLVGAGNKVYIAGRNGKTTVIRHGGEFEVLATNVLDDGFEASPAIAGDELFLRGRKHLYCIAED